MIITKLYKGEVELVFNEAKHLYTVGGKRVFGATSILRVINKPALMYWAVNLAAAHGEANWEPGKSYDEIEISEIIKDAKYAHRRTTSKAADTGSMVHKWIEDWTKAMKDGTEPPKKPVNEKIRKSIDQFLQWIKDNKVDIVLPEQIVYSRKYNFAGTFDFTANVDGEFDQLQPDGSTKLVKLKGLVMGDYKTSSGIYDEMRLQVSAYLYARNEEYPDEKYIGRIIVRLGKDGVFEPILLPDEHQEDLKAFLGAQIIFSRLEEIKDKRKRNY